MERVLAVARHQVVVDVPDEGEVVVGQPLEERRCFGDVERVGTRRRSATHLVRELHGAGAHRRPVVDHDAHVVEHVLELVAQRIELGIALTVDLDVQVRLGNALAGVGEDVDETTVGVTPDIDARVEQDMEVVAAAGEHHRDGVDEERHVVGDHLDDGVGRGPAERGNRGVGDAHDSSRGESYLGEAQVCERRPRGVLRLERGEIVGVGRREVRTREHEREVVGRDRPACRGERVVER